MTIKTKAEHDRITHRNLAILIGKEKVYSPSPRLLAIHGRYMPAEPAAQLMTRCARGVKREWRERWAGERRGRRRLARR